MPAVPFGYRSESSEDTPPWTGTRSRKLKKPAGKRTGKLERTATKPVSARRDGMLLLMVPLAKMSSTVYMKEKAVMPLAWLLGTMTHTLCAGGLARAVDAESASVPLSLVGSVYSFTRTSFSGHEPSRLVKVMVLREDATLVKVMHHTPRG
jgi:hypothetical protein